MGVRMGKRFEVPYSVPPGDTLAETIAALRMSQVELATRTGLTPQTVNNIIKGRAPITPDTALALEKVTGVRSRFWNALEANFQESLSRAADRAALADDVGLLDMIPVKALVDRGAVKPTDDPVMLLTRVLGFFGVADKASWEAVWLQPAASFRQSEKLRADPGAVASWLRLGELEARDIECAPYSKTNFRDALTTIRGMTCWDVAEYAPAMVDLCRESGVALVFVPEITGARASGAARWITKSRAIIQLSLRYRWEDHFWFSFFHEAGHVLKHGKRDVFIDSNRSDAPYEVEANQFAARMLIPKEFDGSLAELKTLAAIEEFAKEIDVHPGVVVGRLQREGVIPYSTGNKKRRKLVFANNS